MATQPTITTTYAGQFAGEYIGAALLSGNTLANGLITIKPNIKLKEVIKKVDYASSIAAGTCDFTSAGTVTLTERILQPDELQVNLELCKTPFQSDWEAESMGYSAHDDMPTKFSDFFIARLSADVAQGTEQRIWGANGFTGLFLAAEFTTDGGQTIAPAAIDAANVITELGKVVDAINSSLYGKEDLYIYVSQNIWRAYKRSLGGFQANGVGANGFDANGNNQDINIQYFDGVKLVVANGLADNRMVAAEKSNLFFGTGLLNDQNEVKVLDMADLDGSKNVRFVMRYTAGVQYGIASDIVFYGA
tara:strand:+ start:8747 stop:9661 length:915 start_codon:yes stop_codon:yes gene_type:complete